MAISNSERIKKTLDLLREGLKPFVERRLQAAWGQNWRSQLRQYENVEGQGNESIAWDSHLLLKVLCFRWEDAFRAELGRDSRTTAHALLAVRNSYAHERSFSSFDTLQAIGNARKLLEDIAARKQLATVVSLYEELMRTTVTSQNRIKRSSINTDSHAGGIPWRSIVTPHADVLSDTFTDAEFAADLGQVSRGAARAEYGNPAEFFKRTFLTAGLNTLLTSAARRFTGKGGDPVIELQTGFGGGKTHSMLALYHMSGAGPNAKNLQGVDDLLRQLELTDLPVVKRAVFVGTMRGVSDIDTQPDGTHINTMWGSLAWQLGGRQGYDLVSAADQSGTAPGSNALVQLLRLASPCLILIDEWVAFIRQLYRIRTTPPAGTYDANLTFVQSLTEAARAVPGTVLVASLPESEIEIGGEGGSAALQHLESIFGRMESPWRAATADESFEIVRRRLFEPITEPQNLRDRDRTIEAFWQTYREAQREFPSGCSEAEYRDRMQKAYPIHPALFDQLYQDWGSLDRFQRTRGVLRMIATIVRVNWENAYDHRMILPSLVPLDDSAVQAEIFKSLDRDWTAVLDKDIEGTNSVPRQIDNSIPNLGRYTATRRVARCLFMGTAPTFETSEHPGIDERQIRLGSTQPGEIHQSFGDALRRLSAQATYLYQDGARAWFATKPSVAKLAEDRAQACRDEDVADRTVKYLRELTGRGEFDRVHVAPLHNADVPDIDSARLVVLSPAQSYATDAQRSLAHQASRDILLHRGSAQRRFRNMLVFLAADEARMQSVDEAVRSLLAWESIIDERESLALDPQQSALAQRRRKTADDSVRTRLPEAWHRVMRPTKVEANDTVSWQTFHLGGTGNLAERVSHRLIQDEQLLVQLGPIRLRMLLDDYDLWRNQSHVSIQRIWEDLCSYLYLPRLRNQGILQHAIKSAVSRLQNEEFAFAQGFDETKGCYTGLVLAGQADSWIAQDDQCLLVKPEIAQQQIDETTRAEEAVNHQGAEEGTLEDNDNIPVIPPSVYRRFIGSVPADPERLGLEAGRIAEEILSHLTSRPGAEVTVQLEIQARLPEGIQEKERQTIEANCQSLKFQHIGFERE